MTHPDDAAERSAAPSGCLPDEPDDVVAVVVTDEDGDPAGVLEKWTSDSWLYADESALRPLEPEHG